MTTLTKLSLCGFQCQKTALSRRSHVKSNPVPANYVSFGRSQHKSNQLPLCYERASLVKCYPILGSSESRSSVSAYIGKSSSYTQFSSLARSPVLTKVKARADLLVTAFVFIVGADHLWSGLIGVTKFIASLLFNLSLFGLKFISKWHIKRRVYEKNISLEREGGSV